MRAHFAFLLLPLFLLISCSAAGSPPATLNVLAASSLTGALTEIGQAFSTAQPGIKVNPSFAGSQQLRTQIEQGVQADIFASADAANMDALKTAGLVEGDKVLAHNKLVVVLAKGNPGGIKELKDLARAGLKLAFADPSVPVGNYTLQFLDKLSADPSYGADFKDRVLARVVSRETNVSQVVAKVGLGEVDAGVAYETDWQAASGKLDRLAIPDRYNVTATYYIATVRGSKQSVAAQSFVAFVLSPQGQAILEKYGFSP